jgi:hypothetical protein
VLEGKNYVIILVELFPCDSKMKLHQRERYYIENNECVNKNIPTRTYTEWRLENKDKIDAQNLVYCLENKDIITARQAEYRVNNQGKISAYNKKYNEAYRLKNKEILTANKAEWRANNKDKIRESSALYRLKQKELKSNPPLGEITE